MTRYIGLIVLVVVVILFASGSTLAQNIVPSGTAAAPGARQSLKFGADYQLASWMAADFNVAQSLAEVARQKGSESTREFARQSYAVRAKWAESLKPFIGDDVLAVSSPATADPQPNVAAFSTTVNSNESAPIASTSKGPAFDLVSLKRALAEETLAKTRRDWSELSDGEFDRAYWDWEVRAGRCGVETLSVFREHASPALQQVIDGVLPELKARAQEVATRLQQQL